MVSFFSNESPICNKYSHVTFTSLFKIFLSQTPYSMPTALTKSSALCCHGCRLSYIHVCITVVYSNISDMGLQMTCKRFLSYLDCSQTCICRYAASTPSRWFCSGERDPHFQYLRTQSSK